MQRKINHLRKYLLGRLQIQEEQEDKLIESSQLRENHLKEIVTHHFFVVKGLLNSLHIKEKPDLFMERFKASISLTGKSGESFFANMVPFVNDCYFGVIDWLKESYPQLNNSDVELICLSFFKYLPKELCTLYGLKNRGAIYTRISRVTKKLKLEKNVSIGSFLQKKIDELKAKK
ncbi:MAG: hypothetical protein LBC84_10375 [Prevotellaceae bacterium]|jgi:hypothetical protein|nr:hypothetical protein [Prevotellaceae bacterium]